MKPDWISAPALSQTPPQESLPAAAQALKTDPSALLEMLRDIELPVAISWWPPAPGWWLLTGVALLAYLAWRYVGHTRWRRPPPHPPALAADVTAFKALAQAREAFAANQDIKALVVTLSALLRRVAMQSTSRDEAASLTGESWLMWLDSQVGGDTFSAGLGRVLLDVPYRAANDATDQVDADALLRVCEEWVAAVLRKSPPRGER